MSGSHWTAALALAARLGLTPDAFWALSLREWRALTEPDAARRPLSRAELNTLIEHHSSGDRHEPQG